MERPLFGSPHSKLASRARSFSMPPEVRREETGRAVAPEAEEQVRFIDEAENVVQSDFYSYRYFASEGFLPGYSFPRLPLSHSSPGVARPKIGEEYFVSSPILGDLRVWSSCRRVS